jgi:tetratricopeptide (TPR) repeat protein
MKRLILIVILTAISKMANAQSIFQIFERAIEKHEKGDFFGAISDYNILIELDATDGIYFLKRGLAKGQLHDHRGAIVDFNKAIELNSKFLEYSYEDAFLLINVVRDAYVSRAASKSLLGDVVGSIDDCNKALGVDPKFAMAFYQKGIARYKLNELELACLDFSKAGELGYTSVYDIIKKYCQ